MEEFDPNAHLEFHCSEHLLTPLKECIVCDLAIKLNDRMAINDLSSESV